MHSVLNPRVAALARPGTTSARAAAQEAKRSGVDVLPLVGSPRRDAPEHVAAALREAAARDVMPDSRGLDALREAIATKLRTRNALVADPDRTVLVTHGAKHALTLALCGLLEPDDEVLVPTPAYVYGDIIRLVGGRPVYVELRPEDGYALDAERLEAAVTARTRALVINTPVNPTGRVLTRSELRAAGEVARKHGLTILADEAHERLVYDGREHVSIGSLDDLADITVSIFTLSKAHGLVGARVGYLVGPEPLVTTARNIVEITQQACSYLSQVAATAVLAGPVDWLDHLVEDCAVNRNLLRDGLSTIGNLTFLTPEGGTSVLLDVSAVTQNPEEFATFLLTEFGVPSVPGKVFQARAHVRLSALGSAQSDINEAVARLKVAVDVYPRWTSAQVPSAPDAK